MKKRKEKGFSLIELVIVIAIIAILSAVLIPTFGGVIEDSRNSSRDTKAKNAYTDFLTQHPTESNKNVIIEIKDGGKIYYYSVLNGQIDLEKEDEYRPISYSDKVTTDRYTVYCNAEKTIWQLKWNDMVLSESKDVKKVMLDRYLGDYSSIMFPIMEIDENEKINNILDSLKGLNFTKEENFEALYSSSMYRLELVSDETKKDYGLPAIGDTRSNFNYSLLLYIYKTDNEWYACVTVYNGESFDFYKSNVNNDLSWIGEMYDELNSSLKDQEQN